MFTFLIFILALFKVKHATKRMIIAARARPSGSNRATGEVESRESGSVKSYTAINEFYGEKRLRNEQ